MDAEIADVVDDETRIQFADHLDGLHSRLIDEVTAWTVLYGVVNPSRAAVGGSLVALTAAIREADAAAAQHWLQLLSIRYNGALLKAFIFATCDVVGAAALRVERPGTLVVLIEQLRVRLVALARSLEVVEHALDDVLAALRIRDEATCAHSRATAAWARRLGTVLGLTAEIADRVELAAALHDVGKIAVPDAVLLKPGPLTDSEWETMLSHAAWGGEILFDIPALATLAPIVRAHHERWDGTGYPDGLAREQIPYEARVVAVVDAFHAMTSDRPYRPAMKISDAIEVLRQGRGTQWQAEIVDAMVGLAITYREHFIEASLALPRSEPIRLTSKAKAV